MVAYVGLGSNLEEPVRQVEAGLRALEAIPETRCTARSSLYTSEPMGPPGQSDYINGAAELHTRLGAHDLLLRLQAIEQAHGRKREIHWGPRTLDLDLLLFGQLTIDTALLKVPHPCMCERDFVLAPLFEIAPGLNIPGKGALTDLLRDCPSNHLKRCG
ncbi:MAG: 2-amino-4-hydroxy-6-hydroxymethyldihydropteridine diphosphokinase [Gammaproteobacteria bacterium]|nr:2-amino-4-hydroxy-6-hydroxymethyldihydropteridine diphosphokinase [Gammaproteobacteria bacterium]